MAYYNNLLNMGEPVSVEPLPQPLLTSPFNYTDTGLLPISLPSYATPTPQPFTPIQPGPFAGSTAPVAPISPKFFDDNYTDLEDIEAELDLAGTLDPTAANIASIAGNLASFALGPVSFAATAMANIAANRNPKSISLFSLAKDAFRGNLGGYDGYGNYGTGGVDPGAYSDAVSTSVADAYGAAFDTMGTAKGLSFSSEQDDADSAAGGTASGGKGTGYSSSDDYDEPGDGGIGDASDASDAGDTHICTAAFKAGISPKERFRANKKYGIKLRREDPVLMRGYDIVGPWIAKKIGHTGAGEFLTKIYAKQTTGEKMTLKERILFAILSNTIRPALRAVGALC